MELRPQLRLWFWIIALITVGTIVTFVAMFNDPRQYNLGLRNESTLDGFA